MVEAGMGWDGEGGGWWGGYMLRRRRTHPALQRPVSSPSHSLQLGLRHRAGHTSSIYLHRIDDKYSLHSVTQ